MRNINIGDNQIPQPEPYKPEPLPPINNNEPEKPKSNKQALLYLLAIPFIIGAILLGNYLLNKSNSFFMDKRNKMVQSQIDEHSKKKEKNEDEKKNYYIVLSLIVGDNLKEDYALVIKDMAEKDLVIEDYLFNSVKLKINEEEIHVGEITVNYSETNPDISKGIYGSDKIKYVKDNYYLKYETENKYHVYYKAHVLPDQEGNYETWLGFIIYESKDKTEYYENEAIEYIDKIKDKIEIIPSKEVPKNYVKLRDYFEEK